MSWSLQLSHGDFVLSGARYTTVTNEAKLVQDLRCVLGEPMGTDDMHPDYGSLIDGGTMPNGIVVQSPIGVQKPQQVAASVNSEIERIARAYQSQQLDRAKADRTTYNRVSLTPGEVLLSISDVLFTQHADSLTVNVVVQSATGQEITVALNLTP